MMSKKGNERKSVALVLLSFGRMEGRVLPPTQSPTSGAEEEEEGSLGGSPPSSTKGLLRGLELGLRDVS